MVVFAASVKANTITKIYSQFLNEKLQQENFINNPFRGSCYYIDSPHAGEQAHHKRLIIVNITPIFFNFTVYGWLLIAAAWLLWGFGWAVIPGLVLVSLGFFWSKYFYILIFIMGIRKAGYIDSLDILTESGAVNIMIKWAKKKH